VVAQLPRLLTGCCLAAAGLAAAGLATTFAGCAGSPPARAVPAAPPPKPLPPTSVVPFQLPPVSPELGPEILLPAATTTDGEVARVGDIVLRQSHAYMRLLTARPNIALEAVDLLVFDVLVAQHAKQFGIGISKERVEELAGAEEKQLRQQVEAELGGTMNFPGYLWQTFGMREADWRAALRLRVAQRLYWGYVIRYLAQREDRVQVRYVVHKDEKIAREVADKTREGADFATLAQRHSEDASRRDGGLLPPFGRGFKHPVALTAFELEPGGVSQPFQAKWGDEDRWFVVYCVERLAGRDVPFAEVAAAIDADLQRRPFSALERQAYTLRWRTELERDAGKPAKAPGDDR
jgi:parvulin-like peptidyl-prolyl isomerase